MLTIKLFMFVALEVFVFAIFGAVLIAGLHRVVSDRVRKSREVDRVTTTIAQ